MLFDGQGYRVYRPNRKQRRALAADPDVRQKAEQHRQHQQGDEMACSCGRRWPVGENHP